jgi:outer membrane protein assembly factor BamB
MGLRQLRPAIKRTAPTCRGRLSLRSDHAGQVAQLSLRIASVGVLTGLMAAGCSDSLSLPRFSDINPFHKNEPPLPGKRVPIMDATGSIANTLAPADRPIVLPPPTQIESWPQPGGSPSNAPGHATLSAAPKVIWTADAGTGSSSSGKVTASPIVYDGRVYTLDAGARVSAFAVNGGSMVWRVSMVPDSERKAGSIWTIGGNNTGGGYGGGLAADNGRLYVATGYGTLSALDPKTGKVVWTKHLGAPMRASPTAAGDRVFVVMTDGRVMALTGTDGTELWTAKGVPEQASLIASPSPAVDGDTVAAPLPSGELLGLKLANGEQVWNEALTRARGNTAIGAMSDASRPVIDRGIVYATGHGGLTLALQARTGERLWGINLASTQAPVVAGDYVFVVDTAGQILALNRRDGKTLWTAKLPNSNTWSGPTLAGGQLWLVSAKGALVGVDAATGRVASQASLGNASFIAPVAAGGRLYVLTDNARLVAFQ